jgi:hypothetical protein
MPTETPEQIKTAIEEVVNPIMEQIDAGEFKTKNEAIDALMQSLGSAQEQPGMKGLGEGPKMEMPEPMPGEGEGGEEE